MYRNGIGAVIFNKEGLVFVGKRFDKNSCFQFVQGGIDDGEDYSMALKRELYEETGIVNYDIVSKSYDSIKYDLPQEIAKKIWNGLYKGQNQWWYLVYFKGSNQDINLCATDHPEFSDWEWRDFKNVVDNIVYFKMDMYKKIYEQFSNNIKVFLNEKQF